MCQLLISTFLATISCSSKTQGSAPNKDNKGEMQVLPKVYQFVMSFPSPKSKCTQEAKFYFVYSH